LDSSITGGSVGRGGGGSGAVANTSAQSQTVTHGAVASGSHPAANSGAGGSGRGSTDGGAGNGGSGTVILRYPHLYTISVGAGLTWTDSEEKTADGGVYKYAVFTAGDGDVSFS
jgi:hypothetical protein